MGTAMRRKWWLLMGGTFSICLAARALAHPPTNTPTSAPSAATPTPDITAGDCDPNDPTLLLPDLRPLSPSDIRVIRSGGNGHRMLLFTTAIANTGDGPLILHGKTVDGPNGPVTQASQEIFRSNGPSCFRVAGDFIYHPQHRHFHFEDFELYQLWNGDPGTGTVIAQATKTSFCLIDIAKLVGFNTTPQFINDCENPEGTQGIDVGFADVYDFLLPGQSIDLDADPANPVPPGTYFLTNTVNPDKNVWEKNYDNDVGTASVRIIARSLLQRSDPAGGTVTSDPPGGTVTSDPAGGTVTSATGPHHAPHSPHQSLGPVMAPRSRFPHAPHNPHMPVPNHPGP